MTLLQKPAARACDSLQTAVSAVAQGLKRRFLKLKSSRAPDVKICSGKWTGGSPKGLGPGRRILLHPALAGWEALAERQGSPAAAGPTSMRVFTCPADKAMRCDWIEPTSSYHSASTKCVNEQTRATCLCSRTRSNSGTLKSGPWHYDTQILLPRDH